MSLDNLIEETLKMGSSDQFEEIFVDATVEDAIKRLGEMRMLALTEGGIVGITELGRRVLVGLLFYVYKSAAEEAAKNAFGPATLHALRILCYEQLPDELRTEFERIANEGFPGAPGGGSIDAG